MATPTRSACSRPILSILAAVALAPWLAGCRAAPPPTLAEALQAQGSAAARARAFLRVAVQGPAAERRRAAFLWGLLACEVPSPTAASSAFRLARPSGGRAVLAARRLVGALERARVPARQWQLAAQAAWLSPSERTALLLAGAEELGRRGDVEGAAACARGALGMVGADRWRLLVVLARAGDAAALRELALDYPALLGAHPDLPPLEQVSRSFTPVEWSRQAAGWLAAGDAARALLAARRGGRGAGAVAARAALRLRWAQEALRWAGEVDGRGAERFLLEAEAYRQLAWSGTGAERRRWFEAVAGAARRAAVVAGSDAERGLAGLLAAEGLSELGRFAEAVGYLARPEVRDQPRFEWVWRRCVFLQASQAGGTWPEGLEGWGRTTRGRRLAAYWRAAQRGGRGDEAALKELAFSGYADLPALWAAARLGVVTAPLEFVPHGPAPVPPPLWTRDLAALGRLGDVLLGWRADLEAGLATPGGWVSFVAAAGLPPLEAIPLLVRGEPRLVSARWQGLPRSLVERYLPLPFRAELERAAARALVPPWLLAGLVRQESAWSPRAVSAAGAVGLAQVLPATAREVMQQRRDLFAGASELTQPEVNLTVGALLLARWRQSFSGSWVAALAAYNAGERRVRVVWEQAHRRDGPEFVEALEIPETWDYVHRVVALAEGYRALYWPAGKGYPWT
ncbi:MAG: lytic transglycosylase domain-containing protein [Thermoanaerobaculaceae bacterium]|nr:lytic transglycosylase domain-containing protein [Thermoanaerobaculaceae bacterium]